MKTTRIRLMACGFALLATFFGIHESAEAAPHKATPAKVRQAAPALQSEKVVKPAPKVKWVRDSLGRQSYVTLPNDAALALDSGEQEGAIVKASPLVDKALEEGSLAWARQAGGAGNDVGSSIASHNDGSSVATGSFSYTATFGREEDEETFLTEAGGGDTVDVFVAGYESDGSLAWARRAGGTGNDEGLGIAPLSDKDTLVTGYFEGTATFGEDDTNETTLVVEGNSDIFLARYNSNGTLAWVRRAGGSLKDAGIGLAALSSGGALVTGYFEGMATFGPGETGETSMISAGDGEIFVAKYESDGDLDWVRGAGGASSLLDGDAGMGIAALGDGSVMVTGYFEGTATFGQGDINETSLVSAGNYDLFVAKYSSDGDLEWAHRAGGPFLEAGYAIAPHSDDGAILTGSFEGTAIFGLDEGNETSLLSAGNSDIFVAWYNDDGTLEWARRAGGAWDDRGSGITTLADDSSYVTGSFGNIATFGPGETDAATVTSAGSNDTDVFVAKYEDDGTFLWVRRAGGESDDEGNGIALQRDDSALVTGSFEDVAVFGPGEDRETSLVSLGYSDAFVAKYLSEEGADDEGETASEGEVEGEGAGEGESTPSPVILTCIVSDITTGGRITNASVSLSPSVAAPVTENTNGAYTFPQFAPGNYTIHASAPGYEDGDRFLTLQGATTRTIQLMPLPGEGEDAGEGEGEDAGEGEGEGEDEGEGETDSSLTQLILILSDSATGARISNGEATVSPAVMGPVTENTNGAYSFPQFAPGNYTLHGSASGYSDGELSVTLQSGVIIQMLELTPLPGEGEGETEGESPGEGEGEGETEGESPGEGEGEGVTEGEGEGEGESPGEGESEDGLCGNAIGKDWRKGLGDWLWLGVGLAMLLVSRRGVARRR
jgi:hypothetical protein